MHREINCSQSLQLITFIMGRLPTELCCHSGGALSTLIHLVALGHAFSLIKVSKMDERAHACMAPNRENYNISNDKNFCRLACGVFYVPCFSRAH